MSRVHFLKRSLHERKHAMRGKEMPEESRLKAKNLGSAEGSGSQTKLSSGCHKGRQATVKGVTQKKHNTQKKQKKKNRGLDSEPRGKVKRSTTARELQGQRVTERKGYVGRGRTKREPRRGGISKEARRH